MEEMKVVNKNSILLWQGVAVSLFGDILYDIAVGKLVYDMTQSTRLMSIIVMLNILPTIILMPFAGVIVERYSKRNVLVCSDLVRGILMLLLGGCFLFKFNYILLCIISVGLGITEAFFRPSIITLVPQIIDEKLLIKADSITSAISNMVGIVANSVSGIIIVIFNVPIVIIINGLTFIISAISEMLIKVDEKKKESQENLSVQVFIEDFKSSKTFFRSNKSYVMIFVAYCSMVCLLSVYSILRIPFFEVEYTIEVYGISMALMAIGGILSSMVLAKINIEEYKYKVLIGSIFFMSVPMLLMGVSNKLLIMAIMFSYGFFNSIFNTIFGVLLVTKVPNEIRARISSITTPVIMISALVGQLIGGVLGDMIEITYIVVGIFALILIALGIVCINNSKSKYSNTVEELE